MKPLGVGCLIHNSARYMDFLEQLGPESADVYEVLYGQVVNDVEGAQKLREYVQRPLILHSTALCIAGHPTLSNKAAPRLAEVARALDVQWIGDHMCFTGDPSTYAGGLLPPILTPEQVDIVRINLQHAMGRISVPLAFENVNLHYNIGTLDLATFFNDVCEGTDVGIIVSLENISQSMDHYHFMDPRRYISQLDPSHIIQIHCTLGNRQEQLANPYLVQKQQRHFDLLTWMAAEGIKPSAVVFELETETPALPDPNEMRDRMEWARELFFE